MTFGEKLSRLRRNSNYTQEQLAQILGVSRQSISKWESDIAYPETDKLVKIGQLFECSMDYLLKEDYQEEQSTQGSEEKIFPNSFKRRFHERKSDKIIFGMPLYHIGRNAHGFFAIGLKAQGVFSIGLLAKGIFSLGLMSLGIISIGLLSIGIIALGTFAIGLLSIGSVALGVFSMGAISIGIVSFGALSVGCFSSGALSVGKYASLGDHAYAPIAIGKSIAEGNVYSYIGDVSAADISIISERLDEIIPSWLSWAKEIFVFLLHG